MASVASSPVTKRSRFLAVENAEFPRFERIPEKSAQLCAAVFVADFLTMFAMNVMRLRTVWLPPLFFGFFGIAVYLVFRSQLVPAIPTTYLTIDARRRLTLLALLITVLLAATRLPYLLEGHLHHLVGPVIYDDTWHFQEINSLAHSAQYPAHCSLIPTRFFSLYYAPWMMIVALYLAVPLHGFTIKAAFAIGCAIYKLLLGITLLYIGMARSRSVKQLYWSIYLIAFWAGTESFFSAMYYLRRDPAWLLAADTPIHFQSLLTGMLWAPHHATAAVALLLCWHFWDTADRKSWTPIALCSVLLAYAFYSSVFVFLGAAPFAAYYVLRTVRPNYRSLLSVAGLSSVLIWPLLWLYLGKSDDVRFQAPFIKSVQDLFPYFAISQFISRHPILAFICASGGHGMIASFLLFLLFIVLTFLLHSIALARFARSLNWDNVALATIAILFLLSTYFIGFPEGDNYASRGYMIPALVLGWICAKLLPEIRPKAWIVFCLLLGSFGLLHEAFSTIRHAVYIARTPVSPAYGAFILAMNQDRHTSVVSSSQLPKAFKDDPDLIYAVEKFVEGGKAHLVVADRQLECLGPRGPWRWQQSQADSPK